MKAFIPQHLKSGDTVAIVSPSGIVEKEPIMQSLNIFKAWGLNVLIGKNVFNRDGIFAGSDIERADDINKMIENTDVKAIFCSRGGYGAARVVNSINFDKLKENPKWIIGFSDVTVIHSALRKIGICSVHGVMPNSFSKTHEDSLSSLHKILFGQPLTYETVSHHCNILGSATGTLIGGNLSILYSLRGTPIDIDPSDSILFIEDVGEKLYHLDRMMVNLNLSGILNKTKGLIVGGFSEMTDGNTPFGKTAEEIIRSHVMHLEIPVMFNLHSGHITKNLALPMGKNISMEVNQKGGQIRL